VLSLQLDELVPENFCYQHFSGGTGLQLPPSPSLKS
jgi:hypothetical protein